ncbi:hypothetical protein C9374_001200 [Naegleria lovaniensis]|uniref:Uncharacterized protein n=1 Tax=Naegleria lovaniensis TaxID=51637 RepID=A0AA88GX85_NAELO|nr:uncharacterized protein C9374_001200 [Naegleria lovaniensis]KAG2387606.1 hypothetical protein C9374_001200 [Naegleria lovaniensis]
MRNQIASRLLFTPSRTLRNSANALGKVQAPSSSTASSSASTVSSQTASSSARKSEGGLRKGVAGILTGAIIFGSAYYYMKDIIVQESQQLIEKTKSIESLKTKRQLLEEEKRELEKEHQELLKKREKALQLPEEKDQAAHKLLLLKFYRNWNSIFYGVSSEIDSQNQKNQQERMKLMRRRLEDEVQAKFGVKEGQYKIKTVHEE